MKISYNQACGLGCSTLEQDLILANDIGFDFIEIRLDMLKKYLENNTIEDLASFFAQSRLKPHALNAIYVYDEFLSENDDLEKQKELLEEFDFACDIATKIGANHIILVPPMQRDPNGPAHTATNEQTFENCARIVPFLAKRAPKVNLCFELVGFDRCSVRTIKHSKAIVEHINLPNVGYVMDSYNIYLYNKTNTFDELKTIDVDKLFAVHLMSADETVEHQRAQDKRCFCGQGVVDIDAFLQILKEMGYQGMVSCETFREEYWAKSPKWVVDNAFKTTYDVLFKNNCF